MTTDRDRLIERRDLVSRDLAELTAQVEDGEIDAATADRLGETYRAELDSLDATIGSLPEGERQPEPEPQAAAEVDDSRKPRSRRVIAGSLFVIAALTAAIAFAARDTERNREPTAAGPGALTVDPASVSNEQLETIVAANPDIIGMRMALADRYFEAEEFGSALDHYLHIAENASDQADESKALARVGWMAYTTGIPEAAQQYIEESIRIDPTNAEARLFIGFVTLYGLGDAEAAIPQLEAARGLQNLSANLVAQIEAALEDARQGAP